MKNNKITAEEQDKGKIGKFCSEREVVCENGWQHHVYHQAGRHEYITWHINYVRDHNKDRDINNFVTTTQVQVPVNTFQCNKLTISFAAVKQF